MRWRDPEWQQEALAWIREQVGDPAGNIEQPHVRPWSTVLRVPTTDGPLFFKANDRYSRFEAALDDELARSFPDLVGEVVAVDTERGWLLLHDAGTRLRDLEPGPEQLVCWEQLLPRYAELQIALGGRADELRGLGVPDFRLAGLPARFEQLLDDEAVLRPGTDDDLTADEVDRVRASVPTFATMCEELASFGIAESLQHDDLHDGQVFVRDGCHRILDWGDSCVTHPFHTLGVTLRAVAYQQGFQPGGSALERIRDAYLEPFTRSRPRADVKAAAALAIRTGTVARSLAWYGPMLLEETHAVDPDDAASVPYGLKLFLRDGPPGSWDPAT